MRRGFVGLTAALALVGLTAAKCPPPAPKCPYPLVAKYDDQAGKWRCVNPKREGP